MDQAKQLAFHQSVNCRTVTVSGEDFKPSGVLTGGSRQNKASLLSDLDAIAGTYERIHQIGTRMQQIEGGDKLFYWSWQSIILFYFSDPPTTPVSAPELREHAEPLEHASPTIGRDQRESQEQRLPS